MDIEICPCCGKPKRPKAGKHPSPGSTKPRLAMGDGCQPSPDINKSATPLAQTWEGYRYGLQAMKPALEPIILFQKPYSGRPVDNITTTGAGALNIDGGRIAGPAWKWGTQTDIKGGGYGNKRPSEGDIYAEDIEGNPAGRWPANLVLDEAGAAALDEQSGIRPAGSSRTGNEPSDKTKYTYNGGWGAAGFESYEDEGGASRMFFESHWSYEILEQLVAADPLRYEPKVSTAEREAGLDELPEQLRHRVNAGGLENEPRFAPVKLKNHHPTLKPISLTKYLTTLLLPPDTYAPRRILVPFAGAGSEMIGAILAGWDEVIGIEKTAEYIPIAEARLAWWSHWPEWGQRNVEKILASTLARQDDEQPDFTQAELFPTG